MAADPDALTREIEQTRAELADTIDAIADRVSPRRAAQRGAARVRTLLGSGNGQLPIEGRPAPRAASVDEVREVASHGGSAYTGSSTFSVQRSLRPERVVMAVGVAAGAVALVIWARRRR